MCIYGSYFLLLIIQAEADNIRSISGNKFKYV